MVVNADPTLKLVSIYRFPLVVGMFLTLELRR
jgi:hypothetical protein